MRSPNKHFSGRSGGLFCLTLALVLFAVGPLRVHAGTELLLNLPPIQGSSVIQNFEHWISIESYSWSQAKTPPDLHSGLPANAPPIFADVSFSKFQDSASSNLFYYCAHGQVITQASLVTLITGAYVGRSPVYSRLDLRNVYISGFNSSAASGDDRSSENFTLHFQGKFIWSYAQFTNSGLTGLTYVGGYSSTYDTVSKVSGNLIPFTVTGSSSGNNGVSTINWPAAPTAVYGILRSSLPSGPFNPYLTITNSSSDTATNMSLSITNVGTSMFFYSVQGQF